MGGFVWPSLMWLCPPCVACKQERIQGKGVPWPVQAPTVAATQKSMQALVVSRETVPGAEAINQWRSEHGFAPLTVVVVDLVSDRSAALGGKKVSSTALREQDAARLHQGQ